MSNYLNWKGVDILNSPLSQRASLVDITHAQTFDAMGKGRGDIGLAFNVHAAT